MSRSISFRDLQKVSFLSHYSELELLSIHRDDEVNSVLAKLGFDILEPIIYFPCLHRDLEGVVDIGYLAIGETEINRSFIDSPLADLTARLEAACHNDVSLMLEIASLATASREYGSNEEIGLEDNSYWKDEFPPDQLEPDWQDQQAKLKLLEEMRDCVRGSPYNASGSLKCPEEYLEYLESVTTYEEKYDV